jgi:hypothetical protein
LKSVHRDWRGNGSYVKKEDQIIIIMAVFNSFIEQGAATRCLRDSFTVRPGIEEESRNFESSPLW